MYFFSRIALFLVAVCGWAILFFGGWIAVRGAFFYSGDPVLMGTGGGLAVGGLLVVALTVGAGAQVSTARDTHAILKHMESGKRPDTSKAASMAAPTSSPIGQPMAPAPQAPPSDNPQLGASKRSLRAEPKFGHSKT